MGEAVRKLLGYSLVRPAREVLFTVVSREEKYKAKVTIDAVVQRLGDTMAALVFEVLGEAPDALTSHRMFSLIDEMIRHLAPPSSHRALCIVDVQLHLGQGAVAAAGVAACTLWSLWALRLGTKQKVLAAHAATVALASAASASVNTKQSDGGADAVSSSVFTPLSPTKGNAVAAGASAV